MLCLHFSDGGNAENEFDQLVTFGYIPLPSGGTTGTIIGTVFYQDGVTPLPNCEIQMVDVNGNIISDITTPDGKFRVDVEAGEIVMNVFLEGASISIQNFVIVSGQDNIVTIGTQRMRANRHINTYI